MIPSLESKQFKHRKSQSVKEAYPPMLNTKGWMWTWLYKPKKLHGNRAAAWCKAVVTKTKVQKSAPMGMQSWMCLVIVGQL